MLRKSITAVVALCITVPAGSAAATTPRPLKNWVNQERSPNTSIDTLCFPGKTHWNVYVRTDPKSKSTYRLDITYSNGVVSRGQLGHNSLTRDYFKADRVTPVTAQLVNNQYNSKTKVARVSLAAACY